MLIFINKSARESDLQEIKQYLIDRDFDFHQSTGANQIILGIIGDTDSLAPQSLKSLPGVLEVFKIPRDE